MPDVAQEFAAQVRERSEDAAGWVMTVEPGIYLPEEGFAVRLEVNIVITNDGHVNLTQDIPLEAEDVEAAMRRRPTAKR